MNGLSLPQRFVLTRFLSDALAALRKDDLLPEAAAEMVTGERAPVKFAGRLAGWVTMPKPSRKSAYVSDDRKFRAWADRECPHRVVTVTEVADGQELREYLAEHAPQFLLAERRPDEHLAEDVCKALRDHGCYITANGDKLTEVPGVTLPEPDAATPRVTLEDDAQAVIMAAWRSGDIDVAGMLALPAAASEVTHDAGPEPGPVTPLADMPGPLPDELGGLFRDADGRFRSPEAAAAHAVHIQGGFSTPAREARRMLKDGSEQTAQMARDWLTLHGLSPDGDEEPVR